MSHYHVDATTAAALGRVAVIYGGTSSERAVSLKSGAAVLSALERAGVDAFGLDLGGEAGSLAPLAQLQAAEFDRAFLILHGAGGEDGVLQGVMELLGKPYTGSGVAASAIGMDKLRTKQIWRGAGLPTPPFAVLTEETDFEAVAAELGVKMIVKPAHEGSSIGMSVAVDAAGLEAAFSTAAGFDRLVIAERWMSGAEFTVGILQGQALPVIKLETSHDFYDYDAKYLANDTRYRFDHGLTPEQALELKQLAEQAFAVIGCRGWGRVDVMQDEQGNFQLLEINTAPGMTDHSLLPMAAADAGISFEELVVKILQTTV
ncbi:D-alanine--D-alanine ligase [Neptuniibacter sp. CAU 1671]|uniref:D-alanine--D-alanine ligase n=1 Tax=Neptuniibacter sp. CAU 1671 TaxID=3032593 RepID=UPI0023DCCEF7|nr:D-alanine--D-alanine ligase [Neptuniibacter sp. CAU 1671]MDF2181542.1 D-alanine--D-alanine ligase [Neptuniibacter sp. CAU 1671]